MKQLDLLWELQEMEQLLSEKKKLLKNLQQPKEIEEKIQEHKKMKNGYETIRKQLEDTQKDIKKIEHDLKELDFKKEEVKGKLYSGKINDLKQLGILMKEQEKAEGQYTQVEANLVEKIEETESLEEKVREEEKMERKMGSKIKHMLKERKIDIEKLQVEIEALTKKIEIHLNNIEKAYIDVYEDVKRRKNNPIALVEYDICTGCHMDLPVMTMSDLKNHKLVTCNNCSRILYVQLKG
ncbi:zinc ribbon domain-containing protein [Geosporobacter ferrireducens]|uniref:Uncharacterized protein n=1 Tax=Geosporobacter ferrireducens TaxID=1424294 RepID=A0A1D8GC66_9FIRM|nr:C4-type zinc ribbon domain-containing protein [Geosporobacter ferrireducens]AOT68499.1 hypothetical protein Gferi_02160 [Geosporobacter ferrireducens]MTI53960.1 hypothetical protein [Geosporobacter ferrireducens]